MTPYIVEPKLKSHDSEALSHLWISGSVEDVPS